MNNDRLKFRVWHNGDYSLSAFCQIDMNGNVWLADTDGANECDFINITDKCTVEMSTGSRDKNGNLIYEGDVLREVVHGVQIKKDLPIKWCGDRWCDPLNAFFIPNHYEIIGNIHTQKDGE